MKVVERVAERLALGVRGWMAMGAVVLFALFTAIVLPAQAEAGAFYTVRYAAPDTSVWYFPDDLYAAAQAWGPDGRAAYVHARVTFDVIWPVVYGTFLLTTLAWVWARGTASGSRWRGVALLPVVAVTLDYAENICTATVAARYPAQTPVLAELAPLFTAGKWLALSASFMLLAIGVIIALISAVARAQFAPAAVRVRVRRSECSRSASSTVAAARLVLKGAHPHLPRPGQGSAARSHRCRGVLG